MRSGISLGPQSDTLVGGKYRIVRLLGEGGMGSVYEVEHALTGKRAAIKRVHAVLRARDRGHDRLLQEARAAARIRHPNVVDVYDVLSEGDAVCLVMELLVGESLSAWCERGGRRFDQFVSLLLPALDGVAAAHAAGVVHRDIKPDNIFLAEESKDTPEPKVIDFGISKVLEAGARHTHSGVTVGTPRYMSCEQLMGTVALDGRADVYAFGVMLYEALTGAAPYPATSFAQQALCFASMQPARPRDLVPATPEPLERVVLRALARDRDERFPSAHALRDALVPFASPEAYPTPLAAFPRRADKTTPASDGTPRSDPAVVTRPERPGAPLRVRGHGRWWLYAALAALLVLAAVGLRASGRSARGGSGVMEPAASQRTADKPADEAHGATAPVMSAPDELRALAGQAGPEGPGTPSTPALMHEDAPPEPPLATSPDTVLARGRSGPEGAAPAETEDATSRRPRAPAKTPRAPRRPPEPVGALPAPTEPAQTQAPARRAGTLRDDQF